jgi:tetratricopeptide (TPR) repeat protein
MHADGRIQNDKKPPSGSGQPNMPLTTPRRPSRALVLAVCAALCVATLAIYLQTYRYGFVDYDDNCYVYENEIVQKGPTPSGAAWAFTTFYAANWHPVTWLSHMVDCGLFGLNAGAHRLVNVGFHMASAVLFFIAFLKMTGRPWRSALVAAIFAVHPLRVESVAWVAERKDVLSTFFAALTLLFYARYAKAPTVWKYVPLVVVFGLGLMAKSMLVTIPFVLLLLDVWPLRRLGWPPSWKTLRPLVGEKLVLFAMVAAVSALTFVAQQRGGAVSELTRLPFWDRFATAVMAYVSYIGKAFWPMRLGVLYPYEAHAAATVLGAVAAVIAATIGSFAVAAKRPYVLAGWLWYLGMLVPVIGLVQVGAQSMADRYTYLPLVGLSFAVVWLAADLVKSRSGLKQVAAVIACIALAFFEVQSCRQASYWRSSQSIFEHTLAVTGKNPVVHTNLGVVFDHEGKRDEAMAQYRKALELDSDYPEAHNGIGLLLDAEGKTEEAKDHYRQAIASRPSFAEAHNNLGAIFDLEGKSGEAIAEYEKALALRPDFADARKNLGVVLAREGRRDEAEAQYRQALATKPDYADAHNNLGVILARTGKTEEAISHYMKALASRPDYAEAHANLGHELLRSGKLEEAYSHLARALDVDVKLVEAQADMGTLLAAQGKFEESRMHLEESLRLSPNQPDVHNNLGFVLLRLGQIDKAIVECNEVLKSKPESVDAHFNLGMAYATGGRMAEAIAEFSRVLALSPGHTAARMALDELQKTR